jgi:DNA (cytosine-5)-methyltransferase 1
VNARIGSLCSGAGMLDRAVKQLFGAATVWHAELDPAASKVLAHRWPGVPNLGDITATDWAQVEPVDLLAAGFPCQPFSAAGKRGGSADERHLWPTGVLPGIEALMPPVVVLENVPALLTIESGAVYARILTDLHALDYSVAWTTVGACRVGACHHRHRFFALAVRNADVPVPSGEPVASYVGDVWAPVQSVLFGDFEAVKWPPSGVSHQGAVWALPVGTCGASGVVLPTPTATRYGSNQSPSVGAAVRPSLDAIVQMLPTPRVSASRTGRSAVLGSASAPSLDQAVELMRGELPRELVSWDEAPASWQPLPTPTARIADGRGTPSPETALARMDAGRRNLEDAVALLPTPTARDATRGAGRDFPEGRPLSEVVALLPTPRASDAAKGGPNQRGSSGDVMLPAAVQPGRFGQYEGSVRRHELVFGMAAPEPTEPGRLGRPRLSAGFPEWMMGLPPGWITDVVGRNDAIRIAGNGVVGQAVVYALPTLPTFPAAVAALAGQAVSR